jgi:anti-sigma B factor antagonist
MQIAERSEGKVTVLDISGPITLTDGDQMFKDKIQSLLHQGRNQIVVDLANVRGVDSAGLGELVWAYTTVHRAGGSMKLVNVTKRLGDLLTITKLHTTIDTYDNDKERPMQIAERSAGKVKVLDLSGQITFTQGDQMLKDKIHSLVHQGHNQILLNLANVTHVDSAGLGEMVGAYTTVTKAGGSMKLVNLTKRLHDLLTITKLVTIFDTYDNEQEALKKFS